MSNIQTSFVRISGFDYKVSFKQPKPEVFVIKLVSSDKSLKKQIVIRNGEHGFYVHEKGNREAVLNSGNAAGFKTARSAWVTTSKHVFA